MDLKVPLTNEAKEKALAFAAQQQMSAVEYQRRSITGTLESSSVRVAVALLGLTKIESLMLFNSSLLKKPNFVLYMSELSLPEYFHIPNKIYIPQIPETDVKWTYSQGNTLANKTEGSFPVPLQFVPLGPGRYPCKILLTSRYDVRLYYIEGVVNSECPEAKFVFETPAFEAITQNIPIINKTKNEWKLQATVKGEWFYGPPILQVGPEETVQYPLTFKPILECEIKGLLILQNEVDGMEYTFYIKGIGKKPLAMDCITVNCEVGNIKEKTITLPNYSNTVVTYKVSSDLSIVWGDSYITIDPDNPTTYTLHVCPWKRGTFKGSISFSVINKETDDYEDETDQEPPFRKAISRLSHILDKEDSEVGEGNFKIWYNLEIHSSPKPAEKIIELKCIALESICLEIPIFNPRDRNVRIHVQLTSPALSGLKELKMSPQESINYVLRFSPASAGYKDESIIFQPETGEEFWYLLKLTTEPPEPTIMPDMKCDLGK